MPQNDVEEERKIVLHEVEVFSAEIQNQIERIERCKKIRADLLASYKKFSEQKAGICPTCKQPMPLKVFEALRDDKLLDIQIQGDANNAELEKAQRVLTKVNADLAQAEKHLQKLNNAANAKFKPSDFYDREKVRKLDDDIAELNLQLTKLKASTDIQARIDELKARDAELQKKLATLEKLKKLGEDVQHRKIVACEENINSHFENVSTGEVKATCEPMLHGVPYSALSKGERLKTALEIFKTLQNHFGIEMPLFIDDAESYTINSFVELPNQIFLFKVTDEKDLTIEIKSVEENF